VHASLALIPCRTPFPLDDRRPLHDGFVPIILDRYAYAQMHVLLLHCFVRRLPSKRQKKQESCTWLYNHTSHAKAYNESTCIYTETMFFVVVVVRTRNNVVRRGVSLEEKGRGDGKG
jgi:hypothetical protein